MPIYMRLLVHYNFDLGMVVENAKDHHCSHSRVNETVLDHLKPIVEHMSMI